jgi:hypothetical protein
MSKQHQKTHPLLGINPSSFFSGKKIGIKNGISMMRGSDEKKVDFIKILLYKNKEASCQKRVKENAKFNKNKNLSVHINILNQTRKNISYPKLKISI